MRREPSENDFPIDVEALVNSIASVMARSGQTRAVAILAASQPQTVVADFDNWNGGTYTWNVVLHVERRVYTQFTAEQRGAAEEAIRKEAEALFTPYENHTLDKVNVTAELKADPDWRPKAMAWLTGKGVTNQGRVRSNKIATREYDGLLFRSQPEIHLYRAFKALGVSFSPLPVFLRGGDTYRRIEPDFLLVKHGVMMVVEVDGDTVHLETPADAHARTKMLTDEGVRLERIKSSECETSEVAIASAKRIVALMEKFAKQR